MFWEKLRNYLPIPEMGFDVKRFDIYRKVPKDLSQPTLAGACISIVCCFAILVLILSELSRYLTNDLVSTVYVDNPGTEKDRIPITLTVELPKLSCEYVGLDIQDDMGRHEVGFVENTEKTPMENGKGCLFHAKFHVNKVPGNFHISTHSAGHMSETPDFTHKIIEIVMGDRIVSKDIPGSFNPLAGTSKEAELGIESHDYIMKIVPTVFKSRGGKVSISYQYTAVYRAFLRGTPAVWFRYDLSPISVKYEERGEPFLSFLTALCAIIGGIFTCASILDGLIFTATEMYKKLEIGKLS